MLRKSYRELILWMLGFTVVLAGAAFLPIKDVGLLVRAESDLSMLGVVALMLIIWKTEKVFLFSGISFEQAVEAGSDRRRVYAWKHVKLFGIAAAAVLLFSLVTQLLHVSIWADIAVMTIVLTVACIFSMKIKL